MNKITSFGSVDLSTKELNIKWTIKHAKHIFDHQKVGEYILSPPIIDDDLKWYISLYPKGMKNDPNFIKIYLGIFQENNEKCTNYRARFELSILNENNEKIMIKDAVYENFVPVQNHCKPEFANGKYGGRGFSKFLQISELEKYFTPNKSLIINCKIDKKFNNLKINRIIEDKSEDKQKSFNCNNFKSVLNNEKFSDLEFLVGNKKYLAHKVILASKSKVFKDILESNENSKKQIIQINNLNDNAIQEMLRFVYTNKVENISNVASDLLAVADKYDIVELKKLCEEELIKKITVQNAIDFLILAETHGAEDLKMKAIKIIGENLDDLKKTDDWLKLSNNLLTSIISILMKSSSK